MFASLIPLMEIESGGFEITNKKNKKDKSEKFIYLEYNNKIFKLEVNLWPFSVDKAIEEYKKRIDSKKLEIMSEKQIKNKDVLKISKVGKFRLKNKLIRTNNSLCIKRGFLLNILLKKQNDRSVTDEDLDFLFNSLCSRTEDLSICDIEQIIDILFENVNIRLVDKYIINKQTFSYIINNVDRVLNNSNNKDKVINELENILSIAEDNSDKISYLEIQDKINPTLEFYQEYSKENKQQKKVK